METSLRVLSLSARLGLALRLFAGYCRQRGLNHPEITAWLDYMWRFLALPGAGVGFVEWEKDEPLLVGLSTGYRCAPGLESFLAAKGVSGREFRLALECATETLYCSMYAAANEPQSWQRLCQLWELVAPLGVALPDTRPFMDSLWSDGHGWGRKITPGELAIWRGTSPPKEDAEEKQPAPPVSPSAMPPT
jgi:hypothetical protein